MVKVETSIVVKRPIDEVFAFLSNAENGSKWAAGAITHKKTSAGPIGKGTTFRIVHRVLGRQMESTIEVTEFVPNSKYTVKSTTGSFPFQSSFTFAPVEGGTQVNVTIEADPGNFFRLAEPLIASMARRQIETDHANLKDLLEARAV